MNAADLLASAPRLSETGLARFRLLKDSSLGTLVPPGRDGKFLTISLDKKPRPAVRRLPKDVELVEQAAPPPPKLEPACVNCGRVATLKCSACAAVGGRRWGAGRGARGGAGSRGGRVRCEGVGGEWGGSVGGAGREGGGGRGVWERARRNAVGRLRAAGARKRWDCAGRVYARGSARWSGGRCTSRCAGSGRR